MSLLRLVLDDDFVCPMKIFDQNFGLGLFYDDLYQPMLRSRYYSPWRHVTRQQSGIISQLNDNSITNFEVNLDVQHFKPDEITVKTSDKCITIEGKHEEKKDEHGFISRHFVRRYALPDNVEMDQVQCKLSSDGVLSISVPRKALPPPETTERTIPITQTNVPAVKHAEAAQEGEAKTEQ